jgi:hypothetical protein
VNIKTIDIQKYYEKRILMKDEVLCHDSNEEEEELSSETGGEQKREKEDVHKS